MKGFLRFGLCALALFALLILIRPKIPQAFGASSICFARYNATAKVPALYGAAFNLFSTGMETILNVACQPFDIAVMLTTGTVVGTQYVYKTGYYWNGGGWFPITYTGTPMAGNPDWFIAPATTTAPASELGEYHGGSITFTVAYTCQVIAAQMKCGCYDVACAGTSANRWQLQSFVKPKLLTTTTGTVTTVGTTGSTGTTGGTGGGGPGLGLCYNTGGPTVAVTDANDLRTKLAGTIAPGTHLLLAAGNYDGDFTYAKDATAANPIVIEPNGAAVVTFTGRFIFNGSYGVLKGVRFNGGTSHIELRGHHNRMTRILFTNMDVKNGGVIVTEGNGHSFNRIDHNEFRDFTGAAYRSDGFNAVTDNQGVRIDHNYFLRHNIPVTPGTPNESVAMQLSDAYNDSFLSYDYNLFDDVLRGTAGQSEMISIKTGKVSFIGNTVINSPNVQLSFRQTNRSLAELNYFGPGASMRVGGDDHVVRKNKLIGGTIEVVAGDGTMDWHNPSCKINPYAPLPPTTCNPLHPNARNAVVSDNIGKVVVGEHYDGDDIAAVNTQVLRNDGTVTKVAGHETGTTITDGAPVGNTATQLFPLDVGIGKADVSCTGN